MFLQGAGQILNTAFADKYFPFAVLDKLLEVKRNGLRGTEILHILGDFDPHFITEAEKMIDAVFTGHHYGLKLVRAYAVFTEFLFRYGFHVIERSPVNLDSVFLFDVVVGGSFWLGLGD